MIKIVIDLDGTITSPESGKQYSELLPNVLVVNRLKDYKKHGYTIAIYTARGMRSNDNSVGIINATVLPSVIEWLNKHGVPFDEIHIGKPWPGINGFYVDDRAIRPSEFVNYSSSQIEVLLNKEETSWYQQQ